MNQGVQPDQVKQAFENAAGDRSTDGNKTDFLASVAGNLGVTPDALVAALENVFVGGSVLSVHA